MAPLVGWKRLIRYQAQDGLIKFGEPIVNGSSTDILKLVADGKLEVNVLEGQDFVSAVPTGRKEHVKTILSPLSVEDVPFIRCVGLNYRSHILETGRSGPTVPTLFNKPGPSIAGPTEPIPIPKIAQAQCDYEGELAIIIGKDAKDVPAELALDFIAGYAAANDVSARDWQREPEKAGPVPQWSFSKSFDKYAPIGPCLISTAALGAADNLSLETRVNGEVRQSGSTADLYFGVKELVAFCSQGQTLQKGSIILTGTPGGVGLFMKPPRFLKHGDVVEVEIHGIGRIENRMSFV